MTKNANYLAGFAAFARGWSYAMSVIPRDRRAFAEFMDGYNAASDAE